MAKLSAHGRTEIARFEKGDGSDRSTTRVIMSDNQILEKSSWKNTYGAGRSHTTWRQMGKLKAGALAIDWIAAHETHGWYRK